MLEITSFKRGACRLLLGGVGLLAAAPGHAAQTTYGFVGVTHTSTTNTAAGMASLRVTVLDLGGSNVAFTFSNSSSSALADVYFDDGVLLGIASITDSGSGVSFSHFAAPANLPGANDLSPAFDTTAGFSADSDAPVSPNGVSNGEWLTINFKLINGKTYADVIDSLALHNGGGSGDLRIGAHVQGFADGGSESFVNSPVVIPSAIPEAKAYAMMLAGMGLIGYMARRKI